VCVREKDVKQHFQKKMVAYTLGHIISQVLSLSNNVGIL